MLKYNLFFNEDEIVSYETFCKLIYSTYCQKLCILAIFYYYIVKLHSCQSVIIVTESALLTVLMCCYWPI